MENVTIRFAKINEIDKVMEFIRLYWGKNHIMGNDKNFMIYQHVINENFRFVVAECDARLCGIMGYILYNEESNPDFSAAIWKVIKTSNPLLGMELFEFLIKELNARSYVSPGANPYTTINIHKYMGYKVGRLRHYYRLNNLKNYNVAVIKDKKILGYCENISLEVCKIYNFEQLGLKIDLRQYIERKPYKSADYIKHRYFQHPTYKYNVYYAEDKINSNHAIIFTREIIQDGIKILKIVDYIGAEECLEKMGEFFQNLMDDNKYEYIDFYQYGIKEECLNSAGFLERTLDDENIIPNYFEPFVKNNVEIYFSATPYDDTIYCFKGDGDQDRPNFWQEEK